MSNQEKKEIADDIRNKVKDLNAAIKKLDRSKVRVNIIQSKSDALYINGTVNVSITDTTQI